MEDSALAARKRVEAIQSIHQEVKGHHDEEKANGEGKIAPKEDDSSR